MDGKSLIVLKCFECNYIKRILYFMAGNEVNTKWKYELEATHFDCADIR